MEGGKEGRGGEGRKEGERKEGRRGGRNGGRNGVTVWYTIEGLKEMERKVNYDTINENIFH